MGQALKGSALGNFWKYRLGDIRIIASIEDDRVEQYGRISTDLAWLIRFMVNGFVRPSDIKFLQHQHAKNIQPCFGAMPVAHTPVSAAKPVAVHTHTQLVAA